MFCAIVRVFLFNCPKNDFEFIQVSLGIPRLGMAQARSLISRFGNLTALFEATPEQLLVRKKRKRPMFFSLASRSLFRCFSLRIECTFSMCNGNMLIIVCCLYCECPCTCVYVWLCSSLVLLMSQLVTFGRISRG